MEVQTAWVKPPRQIGGLDHLAVQAPCINLYGRLLPGITNVTDRARYYSFYPWIVWALEQEGFRYNDAFIDHFRKADCLFTLISHRHAQVTGSDSDDHSAATIGSMNLSKQIADIREGNSVRLSDFAHRDQNRQKYFKNKLGGLGQYYMGVFRELNIMDGSVSQGIKNTNQIGRTLAEAFDQKVNRKLFVQTINEDVVTVERLDLLIAFCPCQITNNPEEHSILTDLFFVQKSFEETDMMPRRRSLQIILWLADQLAKKGEAISLDNFRGCTYSNALPDGTDWTLPEMLKQNRRRWSVYQRNELLSLAIQGIFYVVLDSYQETDQQFHSVEQLCDWFLISPEVQHLTKDISLDMNVSELAEKASEWLPDLKNWTHNEHEMQLANQINSLCDEDKTISNRGAILLCSLKILIALKQRSETRGGYEDFVFQEQYFQNYPINLQSFLHHISETWNQLTIKKWIMWLVNKWGIQTHFMVALRKLRGQSQSTFQIRPSDYGLEVISVPKAVFSMPRFHQSLRILKDIGALEKQGDGWIVSDLGHQLKEFASE